MRFFTPTAKIFRIGSVTNTLGGSTAVYLTVRQPAWWRACEALSQRYRAEIVKDMQDAIDQGKGFTSKELEVITEIHVHEMPHCSNNDMSLHYTVVGMDSNHQFVNRRHVQVDEPEDPTDL
ncbi:hypothetical protein IQ07DRAFT_602113 [Pyrenochaeta sp. DS3sAY3a]|nr:hypothetical protein IQ07DRAFT_602113 [Pyrenochaeta sp. DS3sAY3a]